MAEQDISEREKALINAISALADEARASTNHLHALTDFVSKIDARVAGTEAVASVVDENQTAVEFERQIATQERLIAHLYEKAHSYTTIVIGGGYAAYFALFASTSARLSDSHLYASAALMLTSLMIFVLWEVFQIFMMSYHGIKGDLGTWKSPNWYKVAWGITLALSLLTALPAAAIAVASYSRGVLAEFNSKDTTQPKSEATRPIGKKPTKNC
jgi:hypothetical protein